MWIREYTDNSLHIESAVIHEKVDEGLILRFCNALMNYCIFRGLLNIIALYVTDFLTCDLIEAVDDVKKDLCNKYTMKHLVCIHHL